jgi:hypothetical protein
VLGIEIIDMIDLFLRAAGSPSEVAEHLFSNKKPKRVEM